MLKWTFGSIMSDMLFVEIGVMQGYHLQRVENAECSENTSHELELQTGLI